MYKTLRPFVFKCFFK